MPLEMFFKTDLIDFLTGNDTYTPPSQWYLGMLIDTTEVGGGWYARQAINFAAATVGTTPYAASTNTITYNMVTTAAGTVNKFGLFGSLAGAGDPLITSGTMYPSSIILATGTIVKINAGTARLY